jgi:hypothetical protein
MGDEKKFLVTIFHDSVDNNGKIHRVIQGQGYKRSFVRSGESYDLPDNMFVKKVKGINPKEIQNMEMQAVTKLLQEKSIEHGNLGFFVGEDWTAIVSVEE